MAAPEVKEQAGKILQQAAGYIGMRTIKIGLGCGLFEAIAKHPDGVSVQGLAKETDCDPFFLQVWCRAAFASEVLELENPSESEKYDPVERRFDASQTQRFRLAPHMDKLLLDRDFPGFVGALPEILDREEIFDRFPAHLKSGKPFWWNDCSPEFIQNVSDTGWSFYVRLIPDGLSEVPGLADKLERGAKILELCSGAGRGTLRLARTYPKCSITAVDGDEYSVGIARKCLADAGVADRTEVVCSTLEDLQLSGIDVAIINISMHECRDIDRVMRNTRSALVPGGVFVISDFPFPAATKDCRTVPARVMSGIQFFEAMIGDQLMPTREFVGLLGRYEFDSVGSFDVTPVHAVSYGTRR